uniref:Uncharacterized protein n=1 Tax=viral metagenome TaxID=1070528 RepID=A0A6C0LC60_9ZZZZ
MSYSQDFIQFIKSTLVNACYIGYCKQVYASADIESQNYKINLMDYKNKKYIWDNIFNNVKDLLNYYMHLSVDHLDILNTQNKVTYSQNRLSTIYEQLTFQSFVDDQINFQKVGYREYQNFVKSMKDPSFKSKMVDRYRTYMEITTLKNHIVYVIGLHLAKQLDCSTMFTDEECEDMDTMVNAIPYFEHLSKNYWTVEDVETGLIHRTTDTPIKNINFNSLESRVLKQITESM